MFQSLQLDLGIVTVRYSESLMLQIAALRSENLVPDVFIFASHPETISVGSRDGRSLWPDDLLVSPSRLKEEGIAFTRSVRGGGITFHWPGQLVCYPLLALRLHERDVRQYMSKLEHVALECLESLGVQGRLNRATSGHIGVWVGKRKIVSMGVRISRWITSFGFSLNLGGDYHQSAYVRPCGLDGISLVTLEEILGYRPSRQDAIQAIKQAIKRNMQREMRIADLSYVWDQLKEYGSLRRKQNAICPADAQEVTG